MRIRTAIVLAALIYTFIMWLGVESAREDQCNHLTIRTPMPHRYTLLEGCQLQHADGIWRSAISIDVR